MNKRYVICSGCLTGGGVNYSAKNNWCLFGITELLNDFWLGYNVNENAFSMSALFDGKEVWLANGVIQIFSMYGVFMGLFFYGLLIKSSALIIKVFNKKGTILFALIFLLLSISYEFWTSSVFLYCVYYALFNHYMPNYGVVYTSVKKV